MARPIILDLFCCEGGAGGGYIRAGFEVYGVDLHPRFAKRYPGAGFHVGDAPAVLARLALGGGVTFTRRDGSTITLYRRDITFVHTSPPCQAYTRGNAGRVTSWPRLIAPVRAALITLGLPYVIENVKDAGPELVDPVALCGCMFDLSTIDTDGIRIHLQRLRLFETSWPLAAPRPCDHSAHEWVAGAYGGARRDKHEARYVRKGGYVPREKAVVAALLGVEHEMTWNGLFECVPPAYTEHIGQQYIEHIERSAA